MDNLEMDNSKKLWVHTLIVAVTIIVAFSMLLVGIPVAKMLNIELKEMAASNFSLSYTKVCLFLMLTFLYFVVIYISQRFFHKKPFRLLGFKSFVIRHILIAFAIGATINLIPFLVLIFTGNNIEFGSAIPEGTSVIRVVATYCFFFFIYLTVNSIGEEIVFRCYPIEQFIDNRKLLPYVIILVAIIFALLHFIVRSASLHGFLILALTSIFYSLIYLNWRSIWVLVGIHNGMNFINLTFSENWEMGGLFTCDGDFVDLTIFRYVYAYAVIVLGIVILYFYYKRSQKFDFDNNSADNTQYSKKR